MGLPTAFAYGAIAATLIGPLAGAASAGEPAGTPDSAETALEQSLARAAELAPPPVPLRIEPGAGLPVGVDGPLFVGVDDVTVPAYRIDVTNSNATQAFVGFQLWGAAYDPVGDRVFFNNGSTLYEWPVGGAVNLLGTIVDGLGATQAMVSLAFHDGVLYATKNIANEAVWTIDTSTLVATVLIDYVDADFDFGGLAVDPATGELYATNDDTAPHGSGLFRINNDATGTLIAPYPAGQTDIDGLAVGGGFAYLVTDEPGSIYVWDFAGGAYATPLTNPWTTSEIFSAGAWIEAGTPAPDIEVSPASLASTQPPDTQLDLPLDISNLGTAVLNWTVDEAPLADTCAAPGDLPWLAASPLAGATAPLDVDTVTVTFDSTGLAGGLYEGFLCIASDDPVDPLVQVPVSLLVDEMPFLDGFETGDTSRWSSAVP
jgi:hypothetical protein